MVDTTSTTLQDPELTDAQKKLLIEFKKLLNTKLPELDDEAKSWVSKTEKKIILENDDINDEAFEDVLKHIRPEQRKAGKERQAQGS